MFYLTQKYVPVIYKDHLLMLQLKTGHNYILLKDKDIVKNPFYNIYPS